MPVTINGTTGINQDGVGTAPIRSFTSANLAVPTATSQSFTVAHGLGVTPRITRVVAVCLVADSGYSVGDEANLSINAVNNGNQQIGQGAMWASSTVVGYVSGSTLMIIRRSDQFAVSIISNNNWAIKVYAFA
jgi:hypothetical protein